MSDVFKNLYDALKTDNSIDLARLYTENTELLEDELLDFIMDSAQFNAVSCIKWLFSLGVDFNDELDGRTALDRATTHNSISVAQYLLLQGANVNLVCKGSSGLTNAIISGHLDMVKLLVDHGADLDFVFKNYDRPMNVVEVAEYWGHTAIAEYLRTVTDQKSSSGTVSVEKNHEEFSYEKLRDFVADASAKAFDTMKKSRPGETFYGFAICLDDDAGSFYPVSNTEELLAQNKSTYRNFAAEWHCGAGSEFFTSVIQFVEKRVIDENTSNPFEQTFRSIVDGLKLADSRDVFGTGEVRKKFTLMVAGTDPDESLEIKMEEWTKELNPLA